MHRLESFKTLQNGWDSYGAPAPSGTAIGNAEAFVANLPEAIGPYRLAPSVVGGVGFTHRGNGRKVYVEFFNDGRVFALFSDGQSEPMTREVLAVRSGYRGLIAEMNGYLGSAVA